MKKIVGLVILLFVLIWGDSEKLSPYWYEGKLYVDRRSEKENSLIELSILNSEVTDTTKVLKVQIVNHSNQTCVIDRRFLFNIRIDDQWYEMPVREPTEVERLVSLEDVYISEDGGMSQTVHQETVPYLMELSAGGAETLDFNIAQTYYKLKPGNYRIGICLKGEEEYTIEEFQVTI